MQRAPLSRRRNAFDVRTSRPLAHRSANRRPYEHHQRRSLPASQHRPPHRLEEKTSPAARQGTVADRPALDRRGKAPQRKAPRRSSPPKAFRRVIRRTSFARLTTFFLPARDNRIPAPPYPSSRNDA